MKLKIEPTDDIPCINCITFPICKGEIKNKHSGTEIMGHIESVLTRKCSILHNYLYGGGKAGTGIFGLVNFYRRPHE